jgi:hypothetical protein
MIISDHLDGVKNAVDGKTYDSKSEYYQAVKAAGCEIVGNEAQNMVGRPLPVERGPFEVREALHKSEARLQATDRIRENR